MGLASVDGRHQHRSGLVPALARVTNLVATRGEGAYLFDATGRRYLDFTSGIGVTNTGHCHPTVVAAVREQAGRLLHAQAGIVSHEPLLALMDELTAMLPDGLNTFFFANSGAEAVEASIKLARRATGRPNLIAFQGGFHGRTIGALSLTSSKAAYRAGYQPLMGGVHFAPYPYAYRYGGGDEETLAWTVRELRRLLRTETTPRDTAAILVEPVLGEGGYVVPPKGFLPALRRLCDEHEILLIADEVQTGFGRTGRFFAVDHARVRPDILVMAKAIASGLPLGAIATTEGLAARWPSGAHGSTFGGNVVACAAALATLQVIRDDQLVENASRMGEVLLDGLRQLQQRSPVIGDVRGLGLMVGVEFRDRGTSSASKLAKEVQRRCLEEGLLMLTCGVDDQVIRWIPPLTVRPEQIAVALSIFEVAVEHAEQIP